MIHEPNVNKRVVEVVVVSDRLALIGGTRDAHPAGQ